MLSRETGRSPGLPFRAGRGLGPTVGTYWHKLTVFLRKSRRTVRNRTRESKIQGCRTVVWEIVCFIFEFPGNIQVLIPISGL